MLWVLRFRVTSPEEGFQESPLRLGFSVSLQKRAFKNPPCYRGPSVRKTPKKARSEATLRYHHDSFYPWLTSEALLNVKLFASLSRFI